jgi:nitrate reductase cytochrome c-type subunit
MPKQEPQQPIENASDQTGPKKANWLKISVIANIVVVVLAIIGLAGVEVMHQSNTNPNFCGTCHIMQPNVQSYLTGKNLDHVHEQAGVQCKDCHDYPLSAEISSGIKFITGNYVVDKNGQLAQRKYADTLCTKCHISEAHVATLTDFLPRNPHDSHNGELPCNTCHVSHGQQIDFCSECHDNGGQRMIGQPIQPRGTIGG